MIQIALFATMVAFQGGTGGRLPLPNAPTDPADTVALAVRAGDAERAFLGKWYAAWRASDALRAPTFDQRLGVPAVRSGLLIRVNPREADLSCNPPSRGNLGVPVPDHAWGINPALRRIASANGQLGICPNWLPPRDSAFGPPNVPDERLGIDGTLDPKIRPAISDLRRDLIALMDTAVAAMPNDATLTGQRVRLLVDQGDTVRATDAAGACKAMEWWCSALAGYVAAWRRDVVAADSAYDLSAAWLAEPDRCTWTDVSALLDSVSSRAYHALPCARRLEYNDRFWWLADPLWSVPGNDRRAEQFTRQMVVTLHAASTRDERYNWKAENGGDALESLVRRYGWPSYVAFGRGVTPGIAKFSGIIDMSQRWSGGPAPSANPNSTVAAGKGAVQGSYKPGSNNPNAPVDPVVTAYGQAGGPAGGISSDRQNVSIESFFENVQAHFGKDFNIGPLYIGDIRNPAAPGNHPEPTMGSTFEYSVGRIHAIPSAAAVEEPFTAQASDWALGPPRDTVDARNWWPDEHYAPPHPLVQFTDFQSAQLRRERYSLLAFSTNLGLTDLARRPSERVDAQMLISSGPSDIQSIATRHHGATERAVFLEPMPAGPVVVSVEIPWDTTGKPGARTRFGVEPPPPLSQLPRGTTAISDPVLLAAPMEGHRLPLDGPAAIEFMLGQTALSHGTHAIGVYWETYGFTAEDSVEVSLRVQRKTPLTLVERAATAAGVADNANTPVTMSWKEPQPGHDRRTIDGLVPIQMRSVVVDISSLREGSYELEVSVGKSGQTGVRSTRSFSIR